MSVQFSKEDVKERLEAIGISLESLEVFMCEDFKESTDLLRDAQRCVAGAILALEPSQRRGGDT